MNPKISVIVPVYNVENYLARCVDSILAQTFSDFELLLIDDGSTDASGRIAEGCVVKDSRVRVYHQQNGGVTSARAAGVSKSKGEWICFIDSDDYVDSDYLKILLNATDGGRYELVVCNASEDCVVDVDRARKCCITGELIPPSLCMRLIKKSLFSDSVLDIPRKISKGEDMLGSIRLSFNTERPFQVLKDNIYHYLPLSTGLARSHGVGGCDYEEEYHKYRLESIPEQYRRKYMPEMISSRLNALRLIAFQSLSDFSWRKSSFVSHLEADIEAVDYPLDKGDGRMLYGALPCIFFAVFRKKCRSLCRRLLRKVKA